MTPRNKYWAQVFALSSLAGIPGYWQYREGADGYLQVTYWATSGRLYSFRPVRPTVRYVWCHRQVRPSDAYAQTVDTRIRYAHNN